MEQDGRIRASDAEREAIVARLDRATAQGRLTLEEFAERSQLAYAARTRGELADLVGDLPDDTDPGGAVAAAGTPVHPRSYVPGSNVPAVPVSPTGRAPSGRADNGSIPAIALFLGVVSIPAPLIGMPSGILGAMAILMGVLSLRRTQRGARGRGMAIAGLVCGAVGLSILPLLNQLGTGY